MESKTYDKLLSISTEQFIEALSNRSSDLYDKEINGAIFFDGAEDYDAEDLKDIFKKLEDKLANDFIDQETMNTYKRTLIKLLEDNNIILNKRKNEEVTDSETALQHVKICTHLSRLSFDYFSQNID